MKVRVVGNTITPKFIKLSAELREPLLLSMGNIGYADILRTFKTEGGNIGESWKKLSPLTILWRRKGKGKDKKGKAKADKILGSDNLAFGLHVKTLTTQGKVELRTNKMVNGIDIAAVHNKGASFNISKKQQGWFWYRGVHWPLNKKLTIPQRKFMEISGAAFKEMEDLPTKIVKGL